MGFFRNNGYAVSAMALLSVSATWSQSVSPTDRLRQIQRQYQQLVGEWASEEALIQERQLNYGKASYDASKDAIEDLVGLVKGTPPYEDSGESLTHYVEFMLRVKDLMDTSFKTLNDIIDSKSSITAKDLALQRLNTNLAQANASVRAFISIQKAVRQPNIRLTPIPYDEPDWTALDQAIEQMREQDMPDRTTATTSRQGLVDAMNRTQAAQNQCLSRFVACTARCSGTDSARCIAACNNCAAENAATLNAIQAVSDFDAKARPRQ